MTKDEILQLAKQVGLAYDGFGVAFIPLESAERFANLIVAREKAEALLEFESNHNKRPLELRFFEKVDKTETCWNWTGSKNRSGYGYLHFVDGYVRKPYRAHRLSWELHFGEIPEGVLVLHKCDNRACVNPMHLFLGNHKDNMQDCAAKGRVKTVGQSRKTHCINGHEFSPENTRINKFGHRVCLACQKAAGLARRTR
jgi:hypothetical protein